MKKQIDLNGLYYDQSLKDKVYANFETFLEDYKRLVKFLHDYLEIGSALNIVFVILFIGTSYCILKSIFIVLKLDNFTPEDGASFILNISLSLFFLALNAVVVHFIQKRDDKVSAIRKYYLLKFFQNTGIKFDISSLEDILFESNKYSDTKAAFISHFENALSLSYSVVFGCYGSTMAQNNVLNLMILFFAVICSFPIISFIIKYSRYGLSSYRFCKMLEKDLSEIKWTIQTEITDDNLETYLYKCINDNQKQN